MAKLDHIGVRGVSLSGFVFFLALEAIELSNRWILPTEGVHHVGFGIVKRNKVKQEVHCNEKQQLDGLSTSFGGACLFFFFWHLLVALGLGVNLGVTQAAGINQPGGWVHEKGHQGQNWGKEYCKNIARGALGRQEPYR